ncbi:Retrovirus-related Pol polyprotein from transposon RE1 [Vitis vinifera]|uniref:Retrovirus-related Pol polyprotein from transposon RE1 n=1 Tax=Vitis vinifera TaxID=29760 RepID=A0A438I1R3_VITVI|nr:Retrovirus-related Pol polyprotein from transposon RE1 [Vitis vinifera]
MTTPHSTNITFTASPPNTEIPLITINILAQAPLKLTSTNYQSWKLQFETLFIGYDLIGSIAAKCLNWLSFPYYHSFIAQAKTAKEVWTILANTYVKPSRGRIKQVKTKLKNPTKGNQNVTEYLHSVKACADELVIIGAPLDPEDLIDKILDGLGDD